MRRTLVAACEHHLVLLERRTFLCRVLDHKWKRCGCGEQEMCVRCDLRRDFAREALAGPDTPADSQPEEARDA